ncbi:NADH:flavin oxidoreductase/NADH oxidase [Aspergillus stella-maris]|uniref:NADH:flavin oxidoreductase/NADH oxidase n=1 Tax=Aspergillus stella-maris TaxID=1810926 RepID=UPI003CCD2243
MATPSPTNIPALGLPYFTPANNPGAATDPTSSSTPALFRPLSIRPLTLKNRIIVAPMCMYSAESNPSSPSIGALTDFHVAHLGHLALKGASLIFTEALAVTPNGRISPNDAGLWQSGQDSEQFKGLKRVADIIHSQGGKLGVQLHHAGRKASTVAPWLAASRGVRSLKADESVHGWPSDVVGPSGGEDNVWDGKGQGSSSFWMPRELTTSEVEGVVKAFAQSAETAVYAGVDVIEIHAAHGYLIHQFLSPVTNHRVDKYGGSFENRTRLLREIATAVRAVIPESMPLFLRISATEWLEENAFLNSAFGGTWDMTSSTELLQYLPGLGIDLLDVSSGGNHPEQKLDSFSNYQVELAGQLRKRVRANGAKTLVGAVGFITEAEKAKEIVDGADAEGDGARADAVLIARQFLREPEFVINAARRLGVDIELPNQFARAFPAK